MKKLVKRIVSVLIIGTMLLGLTGCNILNHLGEWTEQLESFAGQLESWAAGMESWAAGMESWAEGLDSGGDGNVEEILDEHTSKLTHYDKNGRLVYYFIYTYDDAKRIIRHQSFNAKGAPQGDYEYVYNEAGKMTESAWYFESDGILMKVTAKYDDQNRMIENYWHGDDSRNVAGNNRFYHYVDDEGILIDYLIYYSSWRPGGPNSEPVYTFYTYDEKGQYILFEYYGNLEKTAYQGKREFRWTDFRKIQGYTQYTSENKQDFRVEFFYDENQNVIREETYDESDNLKSVDYR